MSPGERVNACPWSQFPAEDARGREAVGRVWRGEELVAGALVRVDRAAFGSASAGLPLTTVTDAVGFFSGLRATPFRYDLSVLLGQTLIVYRDVTARYTEPSIESDRGSVWSGRAWTSHVDVGFDRPLAAGHSVAFFSSGAGIYSVRGDAASGLSVLTDKYTTNATLHAVEYETAGGLAKATAFARVSVDVDAGEGRFARFVFSPVTRFFTPKFSGKLPAGFTNASVDVILSFSATSDARLVTVPLNEAASFPYIVDVGYTYRARATRQDGAVSDSGETGFSADKDETEVELPELPEAVTPAFGETRGAGELLVAQGSSSSEVGRGVFEHVLAPVAPTAPGASEIRVVTADSRAELPDVASLGASAAGAYAWSVRAYPTAKTSQELTGSRARRYRPTAIAPPRTIILR